MRSYDHTQFPWLFRSTSGLIKFLVQKEAKGSKETYHLKPQEENSVSSLHSQHKLSQRNCQLHPSIPEYSLRHQTSWLFLDDAKME